VREKHLTEAIARLEAEPQPTETQTKKLNAMRAELKEVQHDLVAYTDEAYAKLPRANGTSTKRRSPRTSQIRIITRWPS
jgi:hypothetical protein